MKWRCYRISAVQILSSNISVQILSSNISIQMLGSNISVQMLGSNISVQMLGSNISVQMLGSNISVQMLGSNISGGSSVLTETEEETSVADRSPRQSLSSASISRPGHQQVGPTVDLTGNTDQLNRSCDIRSTDRHLDQESQMKALAIPSSKKYTKVGWRLWNRSTFRYFII